MNRWIKTGMLVGAILMAAILVGCKGDEGPAGPAGTATCTEKCHTDDYGVSDYLLPYKAQYAVSTHATGETFHRMTSPCAGCHTTEGFQTYAATGVAPSSTLPRSSPIGCFGCHAPHSNETFAMRKTGSTPLGSGGTYDKGSSNTCAMCHQLRAPSPNFMAPAFAGDSMSSTRFAGHHGPQSNVLSGQGFWTFGGTLAAGATHNSALDDGCIDCHMADMPTGGIAGEHSWKMVWDDHGTEVLNSKGCPCHSSTYNTDAKMMTFVDDVKEKFYAALNDTLAPKLVTLKLLKQNTDGSFSPNNNRRGTDLKRVIWTADELGALFNYGALLEDRSGGIHNPVFARAVYNATLTWANSRLGL